MGWRTKGWLAAMTLTFAMGNVTAPVQAKSLEIQFSGLDLVYDGANIYDAINALGGRGDPAKADPLNSISFLVDGQVAGTLRTDIWADVLFAGVNNLPVGGGLVRSQGNGDTFGFDLHTSPGGWGLALNLETVEVFYAGGEIAIGGGAAASSVTFQSLPFGLALDQSDRITIAFSSSHLSGVTDNGSFLTSFGASGTGGISGTAMAGPPAPIPEPPAAILMLLGTVGLASYSRRGRPM